MPKQIVLKVNLLESFFSKTVGLIGKNQFKPVMFKTRWGIHTFGMQVPIDVVILDANNKAVKLKPNISPNKLFFWNPRYDLVLELPMGTIEKEKICIGTIITLLWD